MNKELKEKVLPYEGICTYNLEEATKIANTFTEGKCIITGKKLYSKSYHTAVPVGENKWMISNKYDPRVTKGVN